MEQIQYCKMFNVMRFGDGHMEGVFAVLCSVFNCMFETFHNKKKSLKIGQLITESRPFPTQSQ